MGNEDLRLKCSLSQHNKKHANGKPTFPNPMLRFSSSTFSKVHTETSISKRQSVGFCLSHTLFLSPMFCAELYWCQSQPRTTRTQEEGCHLQKESQMAVGILCLSHLLLFWFRLMSSHSDSTRNKCKSSHCNVCEKGKSQQFVYVLA